MMYILIKISTGGVEENVLVSKNKTEIVKYLAKRGFKFTYRIDDCHYYENNKCEDVNYCIEKIDLIK